MPGRRDPVGDRERARLGLKQQIEKLVREREDKERAANLREEAAWAEAWAAAYSSDGPSTSAGGGGGGGA